MLNTINDMMKFSVLSLLQSVPKPTQLQTPPQQANATVVQSANSVETTNKSSGNVGKHIDIKV